MNHTYIYIYIYTLDQLKAEITWDVCSSSFFSVQFVIFLKTRLLTAIDVIATVSWCCVITQEWWFRVHFIHAEIPSIRWFSFCFIFFVRYCTEALPINVKYNSAERCFFLSKGPLRWVVSKKESSLSKFVQVAIWLPLGH